jgi:hypothetical protein
MKSSLGYLIHGSIAPDGPSKSRVERAADQKELGGLWFRIAGQIQGGKTNAGSDVAKHEDSVLPIAFLAGAREILAEASQFA